MPSSCPTISLRVRSSLATAVIGWVLLGLLSLESVLLGRWDILVTYGPGVALIAWSLYLFFWAPGISVGTDELTVRNVWTSTRIPYHRVTDITIRALVKVSFLGNDGAERVISSWNAPGLPKLPKTFSRRSPGEAPDLYGPSQILVERWERHDRPGDQAVTWRPHWFAVAMTVALLALAILRPGS
ncbi:MAG: hypothetical protein Q3997_05835 [Propionibacteriaceae bacterium]|nr:hypothetical protein [Propionibacteriaceae bacterium]